MWESITKLLKNCLFSVLRRKTLNRMQTNEYGEIEYGEIENGNKTNFYQKPAFTCF